MSSTGFVLAVTDHLAWKSLFEATVRAGGDGLSPSEVALDDQCDLGRWLHLHPPRSVPNPLALQMLIEVHAEFHLAAANVLSLAHAGRTREAISAMSPDHDYHAWSSTLVTALHRYGVALERD